MPWYRSFPSDPQRSDPENSFPLYSIVGGLIRGVLRLVSEIGKTLRLTSEQDQGSLRVVSEIDRGRIRLTSQIDIES